MKIAEMANKMNELNTSLRDMVVLEWGSDEQIDAENNAFAVATELFGVDWDDHQQYLLKATTPEMADYIREVTGFSA